MEKKEREVRKRPCVPAVTIPPASQSVGQSPRANSRSLACLPCLSHSLTPFFCFSFHSSIGPRHPFGVTRINAGAAGVGRTCGAHVRLDRLGRAPERSCIRLHHTTSLWHAVHYARSGSRGRLHGDDSLRCGDMSGPCRVTYWHARYHWTHLSAAIETYTKRARSWDVQAQRMRQRGALTHQTAANPAQLAITRRRADRADAQPRAPLPARQHAAAHVAPSLGH